MLGERRARGERIRCVSAHVLTQDIVEDGLLFCNDGVLAVKISKEAALTLGLDPALELGTCQRTDVGHAFVILPLNSHLFLRRSRRGKRSVLYGLHIVDEGKIEFGLDVLLECIDPQLWAMARYNSRDGLRRWRLGVARGNRLWDRWEVMKG